jgi:hypothetical protein
MKRRENHKKSFGGEKDAHAVLQRIDRLTQDEAQMTAAELLKIVYGLLQVNEQRHSTRLVVELQ